MQKFKFFSVLLLFWSLAGYAASVSPVDKDHPFLKIGSSSDNTASIYIGAFGELLPFKTDKGDAFLIALISVDKDDGNHPKGSIYEYAIVADCGQQLAKFLLFWKKPDENSAGVSRYDLDGDALSTKITEELNKQPAKDIESGSPIAIVVSSACHYLGIPATFPKQKKREWTT